MNSRIQISATLILTIICASVTAADDSKRPLQPTSITPHALVASATAPTSSALTTQLSAATSASVATSIASTKSASVATSPSAISIPATTTAPSSPALTSTITPASSTKDIPVSESSLTPIEPIQPRSAFASLLSLGQGILPAALVDSVLSGATDEEQLRQFAVYGKLETLDQEKLIRHFNGALSRLSVKAKSEYKNFPPLRIAQMIQLGRDRRAVCEVQTVLDLEHQLTRYSHACSAAQEQLSLLKKDMVGQLQKTKDQLTDKA